MTLPATSPHQVTRPVMLQRWADVVFLHWATDPDVVQRLLPPGLSVDTFDGAAYVALVPFRMVGLRPPGLPALPWVSTFAETNVRTYVRGPGGVPAVWFCSLDVPRLGAAVVARTTYRLPYCWARMRWRWQGDELTVTSRRRWPAGRRPDHPRSTVRVRTGAPLPEPDTFAVWATARWGLVAAGRRGLRFADVDHEPWPLHACTPLEIDDQLVVAAGLPAPQGDPIAHYAPGVTVRVAAPRRIPCPL